MGETHSQPYVQYSWAGYSLTVWANTGRVSPGCRGWSWAPLSVCLWCVPGREGGVWRATSCLSFFFVVVVLFCLFLFFLHRSSYCCANAKVAGWSESPQCQGDSQGRGVPRLLPVWSCEVHLWRDPSEWSRECAAGSPHYKSEPGLGMGHELSPPSSEGHHCADVCLL